MKLFCHRLFTIIRITKFKLLLLQVLLLLALTFNGRRTETAVAAATAATTTATTITTIIASCLPSVLVMAQPYRAFYTYNSKCTDTQTGRELYVGEAFTRPGVCVRVQCLGTLQLWEDSCRVPELKGNCTSLPTPNPNGEHPSCCPLYECRTHAMDSTGKTEETRTYDHYGILRKTVIEQIFVIEANDGKVPGSGIKTQFEI